MYERDSSMSLGEEPYLETSRNSISQRSVKNAPYIKERDSCRAKPCIAGLTSLCMPKGEGEKVSQKIPESKKGMEKKEEREKTRQFEILVSFSFTYSDPELTRSVIICNNAQSIPTDVKRSGKPRGRTLSMSFSTPNSNKTYRNKIPYASLIREPEPSAMMAAVFH